MAGNTLSITDGAVLAAMNVADKYCKERQVSDNLQGPAEAGPGRERPPHPGAGRGQAGGPQSRPGGEGDQGPKQGPRQEET